MRRLSYMKLELNLLTVNIWRITVTYNKQYWSLIKWTFYLNRSSSVLYFAVVKYTNSLIIYILVSIFGSGRVISAK